MCASVTHDYAVQYIKSLNWVTEAVKNAMDMCGNSGIKALDVWCVPQCKYVTVSRSCPHTHYKNYYLFSKNCAIQ
jgi:hypothetical protein